MVHLHIAISCTMHTTLSYTKTKNDSFPCSQHDRRCILTTPSHVKKVHSEDHYFCAILNLCVPRILQIKVWQTKSCLMTHWGIETCGSFEIQLSLKYMVHLLVTRCKYPVHSSQHKNGKSWYFSICLETINKTEGETKLTAPGHRTWNATNKKIRETWQPSSVHSGLRLHVT